MNSATPEKVSEETPSALDSAVIAEKETNAQRLLSPTMGPHPSPVDRLRIGRKALPGSGS